MNRTIMENLRMSGPFATGSSHPPLVAILRGLAPELAPQTGRVLYDAGFRMLEVPLNRPGALDSIAALVDALPDDAWIGAGTVLTCDAVADVAAAGGRLVISPDCNPEVIRATRARDLWSLPGVATPSEAFAALRAGAHALKAFPAEALPPAVIKAWRAVVPQAVPLFPVGGITPERMGEYLAAGASGFGLGSPLYTPERPLDDLQQRTTRFVAAWARLAA